MNYQVGYCTNVHAGTTLQEVRANLIEFSEPVKARVSPESSLGIGMWLSVDCARQLSDSKRLGELNDYLENAGLYPFTFNGFPFGNFHDKVVKRQVYSPTWAEKERLEYTLQLANIQSQLLPDGATGSISTLPIGWPQDGFAVTWNSGDQDTVTQAAANLKEVANSLHAIFEKTGRKIQLAIEPEPGCLIDNKDGAIRFFEEFISEPWQREYLGICHDVCHSSVMFEPQAEALKAYREHGIQVFKVQVSSAIEIDFEKLDEPQRKEGFSQLGNFAEDRYLHQTSIRHNGKQSFFEDLHVALDQHESRGNWRVHFHVPLFADRFDWVGTTQRDVLECLKAMREYHPTTRHFEIETYAWNVLPTKFHDESLSTGIARELCWFMDQLKSIQP